MSTYGFKQPFDDKEVPTKTQVINSMLCEHAKLLRAMDAFSEAVGIDHGLYPEFSIHLKEQHSNYAAAFISFYRENPLQYPKKNEVTE